MITPAEVKKKQESLIPKGLYDIIDSLIVEDYDSRTSTANVYLQDVESLAKDAPDINPRIIRLAIESYKKHWCIERITDEGELKGYSFKTPSER